MSTHALMDRPMDSLPSGLDVFPTSILPGHCQCDFSPTTTAIISPISDDSCLPAPDDYIFTTLNGTSISDINVGTQLAHKVTSVAHHNLWVSDTAFLLHWSSHPASVSLWIPYAFFKHIYGLDLLPQLLALGGRCCASNPKVSPMRDYKSKRKHKTTSYANTSINPKRITLELRSEQAHDHWPYSSQSGLTVTGNRN